MSIRNNPGIRTTDGLSDGDFDTIDLSQGETSLTIGGESGTAGQILKKDANNIIEWGDEQTITATLPIVFNNGNVSFDTGNAETGKIRINNITIGGSVKKLLHIGTTISLEENNGLIICNKIDSDNINMVNNGDFNIYSDLSSTLELTINKDSILPSSGNTNYIIGDSSNPINEIVTNSLHSKVISIIGDLSGNFLQFSGTSISGNTNAHITGFKSFTLQQGDGSDATKLISSNGNTITTHGGLLKTFGGNLDMERVIGVNTTRGQILNFSLIRGNTYALPSQNSIDFIGEARIRRIYTDDLVLYAFNDAGLNSASKIIISGTNNSINGDGSTTIGNIASINVSTITNSTLNTTTGNIATANISGVLTATASAIFTNGFKQTSGGGNFSMTGAGAFVCNTAQMGTTTFSGTISMSNQDIIGIKALGFQGGGGGIDMNNTDLVNVKTISGLGGNVDMNNQDIINVKAIGFHSSGTGINMNNKAITNVGGISMTSSTGDIDMNNGNITECNSITCSTLNLSGEISSSNIPSTITGNKTFSGNITTNDITISATKTISFTEDTALTCKYHTDFFIETQFLANQSATNIEQYHFNSCWFIGNRGEGYYESEIIDAIEPFGTGRTGVRVLGSGTGTTGGFSTYPNLRFQGTSVVNPGDLTTRRYVLSKIFPPNAFTDLHFITYKAIAGNGLNGGGSITTGSRLYFIWDKGSGTHAHRGYNFPPTTSPATTTDNYYVLVGTQYMSGSWTDYTIDIYGVNMPSSTNIVLSSTQRANFLNARTCGFVNLNSGGEENIGITNISMLSKGQINTGNLIDNVGEINNINLKGNGYLDGSIYGFSYLGLNYCNGWYYQMLCDCNWRGDDDDETPSSLMMREPPVSFAGTNNTYGGLVLQGTHTQAYYNFNCPPGYRVVGYFVGLKNSNGTMNTTLASGSFYNHLIKYGNLGTDNSTGATSSKSFIISEATDSNGTPNPIATNENANRSIRRFNIEIPVRRTGGVGTGCIVPYTNNFPNLTGAKQFGTYNQLRDTNKYSIMCFKSYPGWTNSFAFSGGYIKYERWDGENN